MKTKISERVCHTHSRWHNFIKMVWFLRIMIMWMYVCRAGECVPMCLCLTISSLHPTSARAEQCYRSCYTSTRRSSTLTCSTSFSRLTGNVSLTTARSNENTNTKVTKKKMFSYYYIWASRIKHKSRCEVMGEVTFLIFFPPWPLFFHKIWV